MSNTNEEAEYISFWDDEAWPRLHARFKENAERGLVPFVNGSVALWCFADAVRDALQQIGVDPSSAKWDAECGIDGNDIELTIVGRRFVMEGKHVKDTGRMARSSSTATLKGLVEDLVKLCAAEGPITERLLVLTAIASTKGSWTEWERQMNGVPDGLWKEGAQGPMPWPHYFDRSGTWSIEVPELGSLWMALHKTDAGSYWERLKRNGLKRIELERVVGRTGDHAKFHIWSVRPVFGE